MNCTNVPLGQPEPTVTVAVLFVEFGSAVDEVTSAVLVTLVAPAPTVNVDWIVSAPPDASDANEHGNGVEHAPLLLWNARPRPGLSLTNTLFAAEGPRFVTVTVKVIWPDEGIVDGPVFVIERSAFGVIVVVTVAVLFALFVSGGVELTVAVFVTGAVVVALTVYVALIVAPAPGARVPMLHGNDVQNVLLTGPAVVPMGVGSFTCTPVAVEGPLLITLIV